MNELYHHGILGMKWGVRRYQNKDGSLTPEGRKRLALDRYDADHNEDIVLKKGTRGSRVVSMNRIHEYSDPEVGGSATLGKKYIKDVLDTDVKKDTKYLSIDNIRNSGRPNGKEYYLSWFTDNGWDPDAAQVTMYALTKDVRIASGKKVMDELLNEVGLQKITDLIEQNKTAKSLALDYAGNKELRTRVNKKFKDMGYDGVEDINDLDTDMPILLFDSTNKAVRDARVQSGRDAIEEILERQGK